VDPKEIVRSGYHKVSQAYRPDALDPNDPAVVQYAKWLSELMPAMPARSAILDLGCGNGIPAAKLLADEGFAVTGVDISAVQIARARLVLPTASLICADMMAVDFPAEIFAATISFYAMIHLPLAEQLPLLANVHRWLQPGGYFLATVGAEAWTGMEDNWLGVPNARLYWSQADAATYRTWCVDRAFIVLWTRFVPEGSSGHTLLLAQKPPETDAMTRSPALEGE
jgi:SAM-dependent methyltransferase